MANEQLREHDKMQTEFVNIAAHELRTPIQPILGMVELIKHRVSGQTKTEITDKQLAILERNAKRLQKLSAEILDATRIESGTLKLELEVVDINEKVRNAIADASSLIAQDQDTKIQFKPLTDESGNPIPLLVMADKLRMFQVISNLIRNAIKFSAEDRGIITVTTGKKDDQVVVSVKDQGEGISTEMLAKLFTKFSTDKEKGGTGLGLFIAKNIVEAHRGRIWAENNKDGNGATFAFTLPLADTEK